MYVPRRLMQPRSLLAAMLVLQGLSLILKWLFLPASDWRQLGLFLVYTVVFGVAIIFAPARFVSRLSRLKDARCCFGGLS
jgi:uncharacterized membrane protein YedE/YeeE